MFQTPFIEQELDIEHFVAHIHEGEATGGVAGDTPSNNILRADQPWSLHVHWHTTGTLVPILQGFWHLDMYLERMGPGPDLKLPLGPGIDIPLTPGPGTQFYNPFINIPAGTVTAGPGNPSVYKVVVTVTYRYSENGPFGLMSGFIEGPIISFYNP